MLCSNAGDAMRLRRDASPDNLQWMTELLDPEAFLGSDAWAAIGLPQTGQCGRPTRA